MEEVIDRREVLKKGKRVWVVPLVMKFENTNAYGDQEKNPGRQGPTCGESIIRYGAPCGIRQGNACRIRIGYECQPKRFGPNCHSKEDDLESRTE